MVSLRKKVYNDYILRKNYKKLELLILQIKVINKNNILPYKYRKYMDSLLKTLIPVYLGHTFDLSKSSEKILTNKIFREANKLIPRNIETVLKDIRNTPYNFHSMPQSGLFNPQSITFVQTLRNTFLEDPAMRGIKGSGKYNRNVQSFAPESSL